MSQSKSSVQKQAEIVRIAVDQIYPDPEQPRKRLPQDLVVAFRQEMEPSAFLAELRRRAETQQGLAAFLKGLDDLATSIQQVGQLMPVRVNADGRNRFVIEMGERRWLAHLILYHERGETAFAQIDAIVGAKSSAGVAIKQTLQRRMAENVHRAEFSPLEMARGLADRIAEMIAQDSTLNRSRAEDLVGAENGITARRVRQFLALLNLCDEAQQLAQVGGLSERALRDALKHGEPEAQVRAVRQLVVGNTTKTKIERAAKPTPEKWADTFLQLVMALEHDKHGARTYQRALHSRLRKNSRAKTLLARMLRFNARMNGNCKHRVSKNTLHTNGARRMQKNAQRHRNEFSFSAHPQMRGRRRSHSRRQG